MRVLTAVLLLIGSAAWAAEPIVVREHRFDKGGGIYTSTGASWTMYSDSLSRTVRISQSKATGQSGTKQGFAFHGHNPFGFRDLCLDVNGIGMGKLEYRHGKAREWRRGGAHGFECDQNFDGVFLRVRFYLKPGSPLYFCEIERVPGGQLSELKSCRVRLTGVASYAEPKRWWGYDRCLMTAVRTETLDKEARRRTVELSAQDRFLIWADRTWDGSCDEKGERRGTGPSAIVPEWDGVLHAKTELTHDSCQNFDFYLKPDFHSFRFAIYEENPSELTNSCIVDKLNSILKEE